MHTHPNRFRRWALCLTVLAVLCLAGCGARVQTDLCFSEPFSGKRVMTCTVSESEIRTHFKGGIGKIDDLISLYCPNDLAHEKSRKAGTLTYTFTLSFQSFEDYKAQVEALLGRPSAMELKIPGDILSKGIALKEDFTSLDLLQWFRRCVVDQNLMTDPDELWSLAGTTVTHKDRSIPVDSCISFDWWESYGVERILILDHFSNGEIARDVIFEVPKEHWHSQSMEALLAHRIPQGVNPKWLPISEESNLARYKVPLTVKNLEELQENMKVLFGESYSLTLESAPEGPFSQKHSLSETLSLRDFGWTEDLPLPIKFTQFFPEEDSLWVENEGGTRETVEKPLQAEYHSETVKHSFQVKASSTVKQLEVQIWEQDGVWQSTWAMTFAKPEEAAVAEAYYSAVLKDGRAKTADGGMCILTIPFVQNSQDISQVLGVPCQLSRTENRKFLSRTEDLRLELDVEPLMEAAGLTEEEVEISWAITGADTAVLNGAAVEDPGETLSVQAPELRATATRTSARPVGVLVLTLGILSVLSLALALLWLWVRAGKPKLRSLLKKYRP